MTDAAGGRAHAFAYPLQLRWGDLDLLGHVNNVRHLEYAQEARIAFLTALDAAGTLPRRSSVVVRQEVDYDRVLELGDAPVEVRVGVVHVGRRSFAVEQVLRGVRTDADGEPVEGPVFSRVRSVVVGFDGASGTSVELSPRDREQLLGLLAASEPQT